MSSSLSSAQALVLGSVVLAGAACGRSLELDREAAGVGGFGVSAGQGASAPTGDPTAAGGSSPGVTFGSAGGTGPTGQGGADVGPGPGPGGQGGADVGPGPGPGGQGGADVATVGPGGQGGFGQGGFGQGGAPPSCGDFGDPCTSCIAVECSERWCSCLDNPACLELLQCTSSCNEQGCIDDCQGDHPEGISDLYLVVDCADEQCGNACPGVGEVPDCSECLFESCTDESNACGAQTECSDLYVCLVSCEPIDLACNDDCYDTFGGGIGPLQDLLECADEECNAVCG